VENGKPKCPHGCHERETYTKYGVSKNGEKQRYKCDYCKRIFTYPPRSVLSDKQQAWRKRECELYHNMFVENDYKLKAVERKYKVSRYKVGKAIKESTGYYLRDYQEIHKKEKEEKREEE